MITKLITLPDSIFAVIELSADKNNRSVNKEILTFIKAELTNGDHEDELRMVAQKNLLKKPGKKGLNLTMADVEKEIKTFL